MKKIIKERPKTNRRLVEKFIGLENVLSLSCVVGDAMERDNVMKSYMQMRTVTKQEDHRPGDHGEADPRLHRGLSRNLQCREARRCGRDRRLRRVRTSIWADS